jgi:hypothetical protein
MASLSMASTMSALAPLDIRPSMSPSCFSGEPPASALMYLAPSFSSWALIAASSVFQRSSWKLDQLTPTTVCASAPTAVRPKAMAARVCFSCIDVSPVLVRPPRKPSKKLVSLKGELTIPLPPCAWHPGIPGRREGRSRRAGKVPAASLSRRLVGLDQCGSDAADSNAPAGRSQPSVPPDTVHWPPSISSEKRARLSANGPGFCWTISTSRSVTPATMATCP